MRAQRHKLSIAMPPACVASEKLLLVAWREGYTGEEKIATSGTRQAQDSAETNWRYGKYGRLPLSPLEIDRGVSPLDFLGVFESSSLRGGVIKSHL